MAQKFEDYSPEAQAYAINQANRKAAGKRITQYGESKENRDAYAALLNSSLRVRTAVQEGNEKFINQYNFDIRKYPVETVTLTEQAPQKLPGIIVSDTQGGTVYTRLNPNTGEVISQNFIPFKGSNVSEQEAIARVNATRQSEQTARTGERPAFFNASQRGTRTDLAPGFDSTVQTEPYLKRDITGYVKDPATGERIPVYGKVIYVDPTVQGEQFERAATTQEIEDYNQANRVLKASTEPRGITEERDSIVREAAGVIQQGYYQNNVSAAEYLTIMGANNENIDVLAGGVADVLTPFSGGVSLALGRPDPIREFLKGTISGTLIDIRDQPYKNIILFGAGGILGAAAEGLPLLVRYGGTKLFSPTAGEIAGQLTKIGTVGVGVGYGVGATKNVFLQQINPALTAKERGELLGVGIKDTLVFGYGFSKGIKFTQTVQGEIRTFGRQELQLETLTKKSVIEGTEPFLLAPKNKQLGLFRDSPFRLPGEPPGAFSAMQQQFYTDVIKPGAGSSELPGIYGAYGLSPRFLKIPGSSPASFKFSLAEVFKLNRPAIAYLEPLSFRENRFVKARPYKIGDQTFRFDFLRPAKKGVADIPLQKNEAEAIFRIDAGEYVLKNNKFFTTVDSVKVSIDVFEFPGGKVRAAETFQPRSYGYSRTRTFVPDALGFSTRERSSTVSSVQLRSVLSSSILSRSAQSSVPRSSRVLYSISRSSSVTRISPSYSDISSATSPSSSVISGFSRPRRPSSPSSSSSSLRNLPSITSYNPARIRFKSSENTRDIVLGFRTQVKRGGRYVSLPGVFAKGEALRRGAAVTTRDISASFRIVPTSQRVKAGNDFTPNRNIFRSYRIQGRRRIGLFNEFIQKSGTRREPTVRGARLASSSEIRDLISYKRQR